jgi:hypothetical protein
MSVKFNELPDWAHGPKIGYGGMNVQTLFHYGQDSHKNVQTFLKQSKYLNFRTALKSREFLYRCTPHSDRKKSFFYP